MKTKSAITKRPGDILTDNIPFGLARVQALVWSRAAWVGVNIYTSVRLMEDLEAALELTNLGNGAPACPREAEVERVETFCVRVRPYYGDRLSRSVRARLCTTYARNIAAALDGRMGHEVWRGESRFFPALPAVSKTKVA